MRRCPSCWPADEKNNGYNPTITMTTPTTLYQKLVASHTVAVLDEQNVLLFCDLHLMNEYTALKPYCCMPHTACSRLEPQP